MRKPIKTFENDIFINKIVFQNFGPLAGSFDSRCLRHRCFAKNFPTENSPYKNKSKIIDFKHINFSENPENLKRPIFGKEVYSS